MIDQHENLLEKWARRQIHKNKPFIKDGIIDPSKWKNAKRKVLFLLKEAYNAENPKDSWDLRYIIREKWGEEPRYKLWKTIALWAYAVQNINNCKIPLFPDQEMLRKEVNKAFFASAVVNIKKSSGEPSSEAENLARYIDSDSDLIFKQIKIINPDIIVCGNIWDLIKHIWPDNKQISDMIYRNNDFIFIDFWHPANRFPHKLNYYALCSIIHISKIF